jgi:hypothetical protein
MEEMDQNEDPADLERKIAQASRIASRVGDPTTVQRLVAWVEDMRRKLRQHREARRTREEIRTRARELWEQSGRPDGRDLEFWLQAESEISDQS